MEERNNDEKKRASRPPKDLYPDANPILPINGVYRNYAEYMLFSKITPYTDEIGVSNPDVARNVIDFVISHILGWTPEEAKDHLTTSIIKKFKLDTYVSVLIKGKQVPNNQKLNPRFVLSQVYPDQIKYTQDNRYDDIRSSGAKWSPGELSSIGLIAKTEPWVGLIDEFISQHFYRPTIESLYNSFCEDVADVIAKMKASSLKTLVTSFYHPVEILDYYLVQMDCARAKNQLFDSDMEQDIFCYQAALVKSILFKYSRFPLKYGSMIEESGLPYDPEGVVGPLD